MTADLGEHSDVEKVAARLADPNAPIDRLVNNAGFGIRTRLTAEDLTPHEHGIDVMIRAVLLLSGAAARPMKARGAGSIINISSTAGFVTMGSYSATKAWVTVFTEGLATELTGTGGAGDRRSVPAGCGQSSISGPTSGCPAIPPDVARRRRSGGPGAPRQRPGQGDLVPSRRYAAMMFAARHVRGPWSVRFRPGSPPGGTRILHHARPHTRRNLGCPD